jgi:hypothetical protein
MSARRRFLVFLLLGCLGVSLLLLVLARFLAPADRADIPADSSRFHFSLIEDGLYVGGAVAEPPPDTQAVLNLCEKADQYQCAEQLWEPIPDREPAPSLEWLRRMVDFIDKQRAAGRTTFVHCRYGQSRSVMVVAAYLMFKKGWKRDQTLDFIRSKRPIAAPNDAFLERLLEWERLFPGKNPGN